MKVAPFYTFLLVSIFAATPIFAQSSTNSGGIYGIVVDTEGVPLNGVSVWLESQTIAPVSAITSLRGNFRLSIYLQGPTRSHFFGKLHT